uniref:Transcriptional regulator n=1 Tax=Hyphomicrobium chloromethanicum TaxID=51783 RepID=Q9APK1_9HYPH|nr:transcriptional regulator [Hyphomicrobium chloromethanicum]
MFGCGVKMGRRLSRPAAHFVLKTEMKIGNCHVAVEAHLNFKEERPARVARDRGQLAKTISAVALASSAASRCPSCRATIDPFMRTCHERANRSTSIRPASRASFSIMARMCARCCADALRMFSVCRHSKSELMNEQPSKSSRRNHSSNKSKMKSKRSSGDLSPSRIRISNQSRVQSCSRFSRNARTRASFDLKVPIERHLPRAGTGRRSCRRRRRSPVSGKQLIG